MLSAALNKQFIKAYIVREEGQAMAEYGIILALIAVVVAGAVLLLGQQISSAFGSVTTSLKSAVGG